MGLLAFPRASALARNAPAWRRLVWLGLFLTGCAAQRPSLYGVDGSAHYGLPEANREAISAMEEHLARSLVRELGWPPERVREAISLAVVHWESEPWVGPDGGTWAGGTWGREIHVAVRPCLWESAYRHELMHIIGSWVAADPDKGHQHAKWWALANESVGCR